MFRIEGTKITMSRGDTVSFSICATGHEFDDSSRALFTVKNSAGAVVFEHAYALTDGAFSVDWGNAVTDTWPAATYSWDVRYVDAPVYDTSGRIVNGEWVETPLLPQSLVILNTVGEV